MENQASPTFFEVAWVKTVHCHVDNTFILMSFFFSTRLQKLMYWCQLLSLTVIWSQSRTFPVLPSAEYFCFIFIYLFILQLRWTPLTEPIHLGDTGSRWHSSIPNGSIGLMWRRVCAHLQWLATAWHCPMILENVLLCVALFPGLPCLRSQRLMQHTASWLVVTTFNRKFPFSALLQWFYLFFPFKRL